METVENREWYMAAYATKGVPTSDHLKLRKVPLSLAIDSIPEGHVAIRLLFVSVDPYLRTRMTGVEDGLYFSPFPLNKAITTFGVGRVIGSKDGNHEEGDVVTSPLFPAAEYCIVPSNPTIRKIDPTAGIDFHDYLGSLGLPGFTAWIGIEVVGQAKAGDNVFVSAAAGAVGMYAGQLAKLKGCRVIGSTGSDEKVKLLKEEFGYDEAFNYKTESDFDAALTKYFPDGIDVYFDNVGGQMLEAVVNHVNKRARIPLCGMISQYNQIWTERDGVRNLLNLIGKEARMEGFLMNTYMDRFGDFAKEMENYMKEGKIKTKNKIVFGVESFLDALGSMFTSSNIGKLVVQVNKP